MTLPTNSQEDIAGAGEHAWLEVINKMDEVYHELLDYEVALEQKNAALEESQQFIISVLTSISDVLVVCNRSGTIEDLNPSLLDLTGRTEAELRGTSLFDLFADQQSRSVIETHLTARAGERLADCELQMKGRDGSAVPVALSCTPRLSSVGRPLGVVVTGRPVGELRRAYSALRQAHEELKRTQQQLLHAEKMASLGRLVAGVAHELNNPISFVLGNVVALKKYIARFESYLAAIHGGSSPAEVEGLRRELRIDAMLADLPSLIAGTVEGAERTRGVVDGLKRFSASGGAQEYGRFDLRPVIERAVQWVAKAAPESFRVDMQLPPAMPVVGNATRMQQVVMNIVQNAADATSGRSPALLTISVRQEADSLLVDFSDNGPGITPNHLPRIFDPFFTTKPVGQGTGLGLSISYGIVEQHGGTLTAANGAGGGAVFTLRLPGSPM
jgi:two-component system sensor histidine kinase HupT/HoxJ